MEVKALIRNVLIVLSKLFIGSFTEYHKNNIS
jgi:hypothetical protein